MSAPERKRIFILGAGFSKAAGMPDACGLTDLLLNHERMRHNQDFQDWVRDLLERIRYVSRLDAPDGTPSLNIEQLFDFAAFDRELYLMRQQDPRDAQAWMSPENISSWLYYMEQDLPEVLLRKQREANRGKLTAFVSRLRKGDTVATFNYDTLLEDVLASTGSILSDGFRTESNGAVAVLKLHGSIDWVTGPRLSGNAHRNWTKLFDSADCAELAPSLGYLNPAYEPTEPEALYRVSDLALAKNIADPFNRFHRGDKLRPALAGLGSYKPLHKLIGSGVVWMKAIEALKEADEIYVIGWSASPYDTMARFHFASVLNLPESKPKRVVVVDPKVCEQIKNYRSIFGEVEAIGQCAERVDWGSLLGR